MKTLFVIMTLVFSGLASAQETGMTPEMQQMMQNMQKRMGQMQQCMGQIDQKAMRAMEVRARQMEEDVQQLCKAGKRDEAQKRAIEYGQEMSRNPVAQQLGKCNEHLKDTLIPRTLMSKPAKEGEKPKNICDIGK